jgi:hypothetical protein
MRFVPCLRRRHCPGNASTRQQNAYKTPRRLQRRHLDSDSRLPTPGPPGRGHGMGGRHLRFHRHGQVGPVRPGTGGLRGTGRDRAGMGPSGLGPARHRLMSGCAVTGAGLSAPGSLGYQGNRDLTGWPRGCRHGLAEWLTRRPVCALRAAVSPHRSSEPCPDFRIVKFQLEPRYGIEP